MKKTKKETPTEYYRKIYIKSEDDLPKETNGFYAYCKDDEMRYLDYEYIDDITPTEDKNYWMDNVEWYYLPIQQISHPSEVMPSDSILDDLKQYITNMLYFAYSFNRPVKVTSEFDEWVELQVGGIDEYFKSQLKPAEKEEKNTKKPKSELLMSVKNTVAERHGYPDNIIGSRWDYAMILTHRRKAQIQLYEEVLVEFYLNCH